MDKYSIDPEWLDIENNQIIFPYSINAVNNYYDEYEQINYGLILCDLTGEYDTNESIMYDTIIEYEVK